MALALLAGPAVSNAQLTLANGGLVVNDSATNLMWTADANLFASQYGAINTIIADANAANGGLGLFPERLSAGDFSISGTMSWYGAVAWVNYLNATDYAGYNDWTLPTGDGTATAGGTGCPVGSLGCGPSTSLAANQLAYLLINELGNTPSAQATNAGPFINLITSVGFWSGTGCAGGTILPSHVGCLGYAWWFNALGDTQGESSLEQTPLYGALAVRSSITVQPSTLSFPTVATGATSAAQPIVITNTGTTPVSLGAVSASNGFSQSNNCGASLAPGSLCTVMVAFMPKLAGQETGTITIPSNLTSYEATLSGLASITATLSASSSTAATGSSVTLTWAASAGSNCTASSSSATSPWNGTVPSSGLTTVSESIAGTDSYAIHCTGNSVPEVDQSTSVVWTWAPVTATLSASPTKFVAGQSVTLTWSSSNGNTCSGTGGGAGDTWAGTKITSGEQTVTESSSFTSPETLTFGITCSSTVSNLSGQASVTVEGVQPPRSGGGAFDMMSIIGMLSVVGLRLRRSSVGIACS
jgi:hypothetical protein